MSGQNRDAIIAEDTILKGDIRNCERLEVYGYVEGGISAETVIIMQGGKFYGTMKAKTMEIHGVVQGDIAIHDQLYIASSGEVMGKIQYGALRMDHGAHLTAELRNVPPEIAGDLDLTVKRGQSVVITPIDLTAFDPDDDPEDLTYTVLKANNGSIVLASGLNGNADPVKKFTQADIEAGKVKFRHDGTETPQASFDVVVADDEGATSGAPKTVTVNVTL